MKEHSALATWHRFLETRDKAVLGELLAQSIVFESPVVHTPQVGKDITTKYLNGAVEVLGNDQFRYVNQWENEDGAVLEFETTINNIHVNGVDIMRFSSDGAQIEHLKVMIRPKKAIEVIHQKMGEALMKG